MRLDLLDRAKQTEQDMKQVVQAFAAVGAQRVIVDHDNHDRARRRADGVPDVGRVGDVDLEAAVVEKAYLREGSVSVLLANLEAGGCRGTPGQSAYAKPLPRLSVASSTWGEKVSDLFVWPMRISSSSSESSRTTILSSSSY